MNQYGHLLELQRVDSEIAIIDRTLGQLPEIAALADARAARVAAERVEADLAEDLRVEEREQKRAEGDVATLTDKIDRENKKLMSGSIANPRELTELQHEIGSLSGRRDALETSLLEEMEKVDGIAAAHEKAAGNVEESRRREAEAEAAHAKVTGELGARKGALEAQRAASVGHVEPVLMARYEKFRQQFRGVAVGKLEGETCSACRVDLPSVELKRIVACDEIERCPECRRLLVTERLLGA